MAEVDTSIYRNQPNPLGTAAGVFNLLNTARQNELLGIATRQRQLELQSGYANDLLNTEATLTNVPGITSSQIAGELAARARAIGAPPGAYEPVINRWRNLNEKDFNSQIQRTRARGMGASGFTQTPFYQGIQPSQAPAAAFPAPAATNNAGVTKAQLAPGAGTSATAAATAGAGLESSSTDTAQQRFALNTLERDIRVAGGHFGTMLPYEKKLGQFLSPFGVTGTLSKEELAATESFDKVTTTLADQMSRANGSDARLDAQFHSLPTSTGSAFGQTDIIHMLKGAGPDLTDAKRNVWFQYKKSHPSADFNQFNNDFNNEIDVRVFHLNNLDPDKRVKYLESLPEDQRQELAHRWATMYNDGVVIDGQKYKMPLIKRPTLK